MANLPVVITISTAAPMSSRDLPKLDRIVKAIEQVAGKSVRTPTTVDDGQVMILMTVTIR